MAPPRKRRRLRCRPSSPCHVDFRATEDDAWYGVSLRVEEERVENHLRVMYCGFPEQWDERFPSSCFNDAADLEGFRRRFRRTSRQLQDGECKEVAEGMTVCASSVVNGHELKFYDAAVVLVCYSDHKFLNGEENCTCLFKLLWKHGPNSGKVTSTGIEHICLIEDGSEQIDDALDLFLEVARNKLKLAKQSRECHEPTIKQEIKASDLQDDRMLVEIVRDADLGGCYLPMTADSENNYYYIWIENLDKYLLPEAIVDFLHGHTSIIAQALVFPTLSPMSFTRATIFVDTMEKIVKLSDFLRDPAHIIVSVNGRPWVITETKWSYGSLGGFIPKFERQLITYTGDKIILAREGSTEFEKGMRLRALFLEFHEHVLGLHTRLALEERKIMQSVS